MERTKGTLIHDRYRLLRLLGEGGVAEVWLAHDQMLERVVALKLLRNQYAQDERLLERFRREATLVAQLDSPHIVQVYDVSVAPPDRFIAMEYVEGEDLKSLLRFEAPLEVPRALALLRDAAAGIAVAHAAGLIHRDLKPGNILLSSRGELKITDFGIARDVAGGGLTEPGTVWGTSHYIAPEQALGRDPSPATDIYSLGVVLFEMLTGQLPYPGDDPVAVAIAHIQAPLPSVQEARPDLPAGVAQLVSRLMARDPERRPPDGAALVRILDGFLSGSSDATVLHPTVERPEPAGPAPEPMPAPPPPAPTAPAPRPMLAGVGRGALLALLALGLLVALAAAVVSGTLAPAAGTGANPSPIAGGAPAPTSPPPLPTFTPERTATAAPVPTATLEPSPTPAVVLSGPREGNGPDARAIPLSRRSEIKVDGNLSEWDISQPVPLTTPVFGADRWAGPTDLSGTAYLAWDEAYLYLAVERTDDQHLQSRTGYELYRDDSVELWVDSQLLADFDVAEANAGALQDDFQLAFSAGDFQTTRAEGVVYYPDRDEGRNRELRVRAEPLPRGFTLEARIPWAILGVEPVGGLVLGYVVLLNDNDEPQSDEPQSQVASNGENPFQKPTTFGNLILIP